MRGRTVVLALAATAAPAALLGSCRDPTEIRLELSSDFACDEPNAARGIATISVAASFDAISEPSATTATCPAPDPRSLGSIVLIPSKAGNDVAIAIVAGLARGACDLHATDLTGCVVAKRRISFVAHKSLTLPIVLHTACSGVVCAGDTTCGPSGTCESGVIDPGTCAGGACPADDAAAASDAKTPGPDAAIADAPSDAASAIDGDGGDAACPAIAGGRPTTPGYIDCYGGKPPGLECQPGTKCCYPTSCPTSAAQCPLQRDPWLCDEPADCGGGACCASSGVNSFTTSCSIAGPCPFGAVTMCKSNCDCPKADCMIAVGCEPLQTCGGQCPP